MKKKLLKCREAETCVVDPQQSFDILLDVILCTRFLALWAFTWKIYKNQTSISIIILPIYEIRSFHNKKIILSFSRMVQIQSFPSNVYIILNESIYFYYSFYLQFKIFLHFTQWPLYSMESDTQFVYLTSFRYSQADSSISIIVGV